MLLLLNDRDDCSKTSTLNTVMIMSLLLGASASDTATTDSDDGVFPT